MWTVSNNHKKYMEPLRWGCEGVKITANLIRLIIHRCCERYSSIVHDGASIVYGWGHGLGGVCAGKVGSLYIYRMEVSQCDHRKKSSTNS